jgi:hypothetical protein
MRAPRRIDVKLNLHVLEISGSWEPNDAERRAAWEVYVELVTRVTVFPLAADQGLLREALTSLYSLFATTREVLRRHGPEIAAPGRADSQYSLGYLAVAILNFELRPVLSQWHPALEDWEAHRPPETSRLAHERAWDRADELRAELERVRRNLADYADLLAAASGVPASFATAIRPQVPTEPGGE